MADHSRIEWTDATWNPVTGCTPISEGCQNCYARRMAKRLAGRCGYPEGDGFAVTVHEDKFNQPLSWGKPRRIFTVSMGDLFHADVPEWAIRRAFMNMALAHQHTFIVLTKRPERMATVLGEFGKLMDSEFSWICHEKWPLSNVWLGVTAENQQRANERIPILLDIPAAVHWVSCEPLLGPIDLSSIVLLDGDSLGPGLHHQGSGAGLDWIVVGSETGPGKRPMSNAWARNLMTNCAHAGVPFFFKKNSSGWTTIGGQEYHQYPKEERP